MPSIVVSMDEDTEDLVAEKKNAKIKPRFIMVDNVNADAEAVLRFQDVFQTAAAPTDDITVDRLRTTVDHGGWASLDDELKDIEFLGKVQVVRGVEDESCFITFAYDFE